VTADIQNCIHIYTYIHTHIYIYIYIHTGNIIFVTLLINTYVHNPLCSVLRSLSISFILLYLVSQHRKRQVLVGCGNSRAGRVVRFFFFSTTTIHHYAVGRYFSRPFESALNTKAVAKGRLNYLNVIDLTHKQQLNKWVAAGSKMMMTIYTQHRVSFQNTYDWARAMMKRATQSMWNFLNPVSTEGCIQQHP